MSESKEGTSHPAPKEQTSDVKGNMSREQATQSLLQKYLPTPEPEKPAANIAPVEAGTEVATSSTVEPPATEEAVSTEPTAPAASEPEEATDTETGDVLSQNTTLTPEERDRFKAVAAEWQEGVNRRIGKEKQKRLDAENAAKLAREEAEKLKAQKPEPIIITAPTLDNPLADVVDFPSLAARQKEANEAINSAQALIDQLDDSGEQQAQVGSKIYTKSILREIKREAERTLREHIPARQNFLTQKQATQELINKDFPELADNKSKAYLDVQTAKAAYPTLAYLPNADYLIALALEGAKSLAAKQTAKTEPAKPVVVPAKKPPLSQTASSAAVNAGSRAVRNPLQEWESEKKKLFAKGNVSAAEMAALQTKRELLTSR